MRCLENRELYFLLRHAQYVYTALSQDLPVQHSLSLGEDERQGGKQSERQHGKQSERQHVDRSGSGWLGSRVVPTRTGANGVCRGGSSYAPIAKRRRHVKGGKGTERATGVDEPLARSVHARIQGHEAGSRRGLCCSVLPSLVWVRAAWRHVLAQEQGGQWRVRNRSALDAELACPGHIEMEPQTMARHYIVRRRPEARHGAELQLVRLEGRNRWRR